MNTQVFLNFITYLEVFQNMRKYLATQEIKSTALFIVKRQTDGWRFGKLCIGHIKISNFLTHYPHVIFAYATGWRLK